MSPASFSTNNECPYHTKLVVTSESAERVLEAVLLTKPISCKVDSGPGINSTESEKTRSVDDEVALGFPTTSRRPLEVVTGEGQR